MPRSLAFGFTGSRMGMSVAQRNGLRSLIAEGYVLHHGDCVGADAEAHAIARVAGLRVEVHPPERSTFRAFCPGDVVYPPAAYLVRDQAIVAACEVLVAAPFTEHRRHGSGTWYTIGAAQRVHKPIIWLHWDGRVVREDRP